MAKVAVSDTNLQDIANAIRGKLDSSSTLTLGQMAGAINSIPKPAGTINITQNGTEDVTQYESANVNVPNTYAVGDEGKVVSNGALASQTSTIKTVNGTYDTTLNNEVVVDVPDANLGTKNITENGTYQASGDSLDGYSAVTVNVSGGTPNLQNKTVTENGTYTADAGYDGLGTVTVNVSGGGGGGVYYAESVANIGTTYTSYAEENT